jgi:hypothetical protein
LEMAINAIAKATKAPPSGFREPEGKPRTTGKCEGCKPYAERDAGMVVLAKEIKGRGGACRCARSRRNWQPTDRYVAPSAKHDSAPAIASMLAE